jgi:hypothetical protein
VKPQARSADLRFMRKTAVNVVAAAALGLFVGFWRGYSMLDPFFLIPFACLSAILAGPIVIELRAKTPTKPVLRQAGEAALRAFALIALILAVAVVSFNYPWRDAWVAPDWATIGEAVLMSSASSLASAALVALLAARLRAATVKRLFRALVLILLIAWRFSPQAWANEAVMTTLDWGMTTTMLSIAAALLLFDAGAVYLLWTSTRRT